MYSPLLLATDADVDVADAVSGKWTAQSFLVTAMSAVRRVSMRLEEVADENEEVLSSAEKMSRKR